MLGEMIGELHGKSTGQRVIPGDDFRYVKMEISWEQSGQIFGVDAVETGTIQVFERVPGQLYGSGQGIAMAGMDGAIWNGHGIGKMGPEGQSFRFSIAFQAGGALARLNEVLVIGEQEVDVEGNVTTKLWEWK
jgi:hypothetical protein